MGAALRVSRNNPEPNTKMVALRTAAETLCIQLDVIGEIAPSTAGAGGLLRGFRYQSRLRYSAARKKTKTSDNGLGCVETYER